MSQPRLGNNILAGLVFGAQHYAHGLGQNKARERQERLDAEQQSDRDEDRALRNRTVNLQEQQARTSLAQGGIDSENEALQGMVKEYDPSTLAPEAQDFIAKTLSRRAGFQRPTGPVPDNPVFGQGAVTGAEPIDFSRLPSLLKGAKTRGEVEHGRVMERDKGRQASAEKIASGKDAVRRLEAELRNATKGDENASRMVDTVVRFYQGNLTEGADAAAVWNAAFNAVPELAQKFGSRFMAGGPAPAAGSDSAPPANPGLDNPGGRVRELIQPAPAAEPREFLAGHQAPDSWQSGVYLPPLGSTEAAAPERPKPTIGGFTTEELFPQGTESQAKTQLARTTEDRIKRLTVGEVELTRLKGEQIKANIELSEQRGAHLDALTKYALWQQVRDTRRMDIAEAELAAQESHWAQQEFFEGERIRLQEAKQAIEGGNDPNAKARLSVLTKQLAQAESEITKAATDANQAADPGLRIRHLDRMAELKGRVNTLLKQAGITDGAGSYPVNETRPPGQPQPQGQSKPAGSSQSFGLTPQYQFRDPNANALIRELTTKYGYTPERARQKAWNDRLR